MSKEKNIQKEWKCRQYYKTHEQHILLCTFFPFRQQKTEFAASYSETLTRFAFYAHVRSNSCFIEKEEGGSEVNVRPESSKYIHSQAQENAGPECFIKRKYMFSFLRYIFHAERYCPETRTFQKNLFKENWELKELFVKSLTIKARI